MLALAGRNPMGNVLHLILGPESEFFTDIHGAKIVEVTGLLNLMSDDAKVYVSVTRCQSESKTELTLKAINAPYINSFSPAAPACDNPDCPEHGEAAKAAAAPAKSAKVTQHKCYYCHQDKELLPIPGFRICKACAQIELGLKHISKVDVPENAPRKKTKGDTDVSK